MKNYTITVNNTAYNVTVEEVGEFANSPQSAVPVAPKASAPAPAAPTVAPGGAGSVKVEAPMPGTILDVKVSVGDAVKSGDVLFVLEAMKMENDIVAPEDGTIASIDINKGDSVEAGQVIATLN